MARMPAAVRTGTPALVALLVGWLVATTLLPTTVAAASTPGFTAVGSARQVDATGLPAGASTSLLGPTGHALTTRRADALGGVLFRNVPAGGGYRVRLTSDGQESGPLVVHTDAAAPWDPGVYDQSIPRNGYGYLTTRDGTKLAIDVRLPIDSSHAAPYPTVIEYSGYGYADPAGPQSGIATLAQLMGFAVVDVNMRGTGCSGGAFDYFEPLQNLDGYDVIETVAHQPWVLGHKVGMIGISYGAISQLFTAQLDPPDLEAIAPLSTIDATASTLYPGGILNTGFATGWAQQRQADAEPAGPDSGQAWAYTRIQSGDATCAANQDLHGEAADLDAKIAANAHYVPATANPLDPVTFVHEITVPVFLACQWEDEQTGGQCPELVRHFTGTTRKWFTFTNGAHIDSLDPATFDRWYDFLELFVAHRAPETGAAAIHAAAPLIYQSAMGLPSTDSVQLPPDPISADPDVPGSAGRLRSVAGGPRALRQRRGRRRDRAAVEPRHSVPGVRGVLLRVPGAVHHGAHVVSRRRWSLGGATAGGLRRRLVHLERARSPAHRLRGDQHGLRRAVEQRIGLAVGLAAESGRHVRLVRHGTTLERHHRDRWRRGRPLGAVIDAGRGPAGDRE